MRSLFQSVEVPMLVSSTGGTPILATVKRKVDALMLVLLKISVCVAD